jgi:hypothetical protein
MVLNESLSSLKIILLYLDERISGFSKYSYMYKIFFLFLLLISFSGQAQKTSFADSVFSYICEVGIQHPNIVMKQAIVETGWFKTKFLMSRNNLFGFRAKNYLYFKNWKESVVYYKNWQDKRYTNKNEDYYAFLVRIKYASAPGYTNYLKKMKYNRSCQ